MVLKLYHNENKGTLGLLKTIGFNTFVDSYNVFTFSDWKPSPRTLAYKGEDLGVHSQF